MLGRAYTGNFTTAYLAGKRRQIAEESPKDDNQKGISRVLSQRTHLAEKRRRIEVLLNSNSGRGRASPGRFRSALTWPGSVGGARSPCAPGGASPRTRCPPAAGARGSAAPRCGRPAIKIRTVASDALEPSALDLHRVSRR